MSLKKHGVSILVEGRLRKTNKIKEKLLKKAGLRRKKGDNQRKSKKMREKRKILFLLTKLKRIEKS